MHLRAAIVGLLMALFFAPAAQALAAPAAPAQSGAAHDVGAQAGHVHDGAEEGECLPHARAHGSSCCEMACFGCPVLPLAPILPIAVEASRPTVWEGEVMERLMPDGLDRPPKTG